MTLEEIAKECGTDKLHHGYLPRYENHFWHLKDIPVDLLEVGVSGGGSMRMWAKFFTEPRSSFTGIEIHDENWEWDDNRIEVMLEDVKTVELPLEESYDIVIDDGSHHDEDVIIAFERLWPLVRSGGWYVIEDYEVHFIEWWPTEGKSISLADSLLNVLLRGSDEPIDSLHHKRSPEEAPSLSELHAYEQILFLKKA